MFVEVKKNITHHQILCTTITIKMSGADFTLMTEGIQNIFL